MAKFKKKPLQPLKYVIPYSENLEERIEESVDELTAEIFDLIDTQAKRYGVRRVLGQTTAELQRLGDAVGLVAGADNNLSSYTNPQNDFDNIYPWSHLRKCKIMSDGSVVYHGYPEYDEPGGDYMVEVPEFYIKHTQSEKNLEYWVSEYPGRGYEKTEKFYYGQYKTTESNTSEPNVAPRVLTTLANARTQARSKGDGWQLIDLKMHYILRVLFQVEFAHLNSQLILGSGVTSARYVEADTLVVGGTNTNIATTTNAIASNFDVGQTISIGTTRGNTSGVYGRKIVSIVDAGGGNSDVQFDGSPANLTAGWVIYSSGQQGGRTADLIASSGTSKGRNGLQSITYRGVEDIFGNVYEWVDGVLINDLKAYVCDDPSKYASSLTADYVPVGYTNIGADGYVLDMGFDENHKQAEFPISVGAGSTTGYCDYYYRAAGLRGCFVGGRWGAGATAGLFLWYLGYSVSASDFSYGSRLSFKPY